MKDGLGDLLLRRSAAATVEGLQHAACTGALLEGQSGVGWHGTAVECGEEPVNGSQPVEAVEVKRYERRVRPRLQAISSSEELKVLAIFEPEADVGAAAGGQ